MEELVSKIEKTACRKRNRDKLILEVYMTPYLTQREREEQIVKFWILRQKAVVRKSGLVRYQPLIAQNLFPENSQLCNKISIIAHLDISRLFRGFLITLYIIVLRFGVKPF